MHLFLAAEHIFCTKDHIPGTAYPLCHPGLASDNRLFIDMDMSILAADKDRFDAYEYGIRSLAPISGESVSRGQCDEWVGRYCIIYNSDSDTFPPEPARSPCTRS